MPDNVISPQNREDKISLLDLSITLAKHKKLILVNPIIGAVITAIITFFLPPIYTAKSTMLPPQQQSSAAELIGQLAGITGGVGASSALGLKNPNDIYVAMLKSRTISDNLISRFKLQSIYETKFLSDTRKALEKASDITAGKDGLIEVEVDDKDPKRAAALANGYIEELQKLSQTLAVTEASQRRLFYENQIVQAKQHLSDVEIALKQLQEKTGIIQLDAQAEAFIKAGAELKGMIAMKEVELGALRTFATGNNPNYIRTQTEVSGMRTQLTKIEAGSVPTSKTPEAGLEYLRKLRDLKYAEAVYEILLKQFEMAKIDELKEGALIQVVDKAVVPDKKSKPKRMLIVLLSAIATGFLTFLWAVIKETLQNAKKDTEIQTKLDALSKSLRWS